MWRSLKHLFRCWDSGVFVYEGGAIMVCKTCGKTWIQKLPFKTTGVS